MATVYDYLRAVLQIVIFVALVFRGPKIWLKVDSVLSLLVGTIHLLTPRSAITVVALSKSFSPNTFHKLLLQSEQLHMVLPSIVYLYCQKSRDKRVFSAILWSRVVGYGIKGYLVAVAHFHKPGMFSDTHLYYTVLGNVLWFAMHVYQLYRFWDHSVLKFEKSRINFFLITIAVFALLAWLPELCVPAWVLSLQPMKTDFFHEHLLRLAAAMNLGIFILVIQSLWFSHIEDKLAILKSQILTAGIYLVCLIYGHLVGDMAFSWSEFGGEAFRFIPAMISAFGLYFTLRLRSVHKQVSHYNLRDRREAED